MKSIKEIAASNVRDIAEVLNIVKMSKIVENAPLHPDFVLDPDFILDNEQTERLEKILADRRLRLSKLAKQLDMSPQSLLEIALQNGVTENSNWNQKLDPEQEAKLRNLVAGKKTEKNIDETAAGVKECSQMREDLKEAYDFLDHREKEIEENWFSDKEEWEENDDFDDDNEDEDEEVEYVMYELEDTVPLETYSVEQLSHMLGYPLDRTFAILKDIYPFFYANESVDEPVFPIDKNSRVRKDLADDIIKGAAFDINQAVNCNSENAYWMKGLLRIKFPQIKEIGSREELVKALQEKTPFLAEIISFKRDGFLLQLVNTDSAGQFNPELFCKYNDTPARFIDWRARGELLGLQWVVKAQSYTRGYMEVSSQGIDIYQNLLTPDAYYAALVVSTNESGANVLVDGVVHLFIPNKYIAWKENNNARTDLRPGKWVELKVIEGQESLIGSIRDARLKPWENVEIKLPTGTVVDADITSIQPKGVNLRMGEYQGFLPVANISWTEYIEDCSKIDFPDPLRVVVIGHDHKKRLVNVSMKHLEPDPWVSVEAYISEGDTVVATATSILPTGVEVKIGEKKFSGYISYRDVDWGKNVYEDSFLYSIGDSFPVKVIKIDKRARKFFCSIKALIPNPWLELENKKTVTGLVVKVSQESAKVKLPGDIECICYESLPAELEGSEIDFQIQYIDINAQKIAISHRNKEIGILNIQALGEMFKRDRMEKDEFKELDDKDDDREFCFLKVKEIDASGRVIATYKGEDRDFDTGILFPTAVTINDEPVNILFARHILKTKLKPGEVYEFELMRRFKDLPYAVLKLDVADLLEFNQISFADLELLKPGKNVEVDILHGISNPYTVFVKWNGYIGFIPRNMVEEVREIDNLKSIELTVAEAPFHSQQMIRFVIPDLEEEILKEEERADRMRVIERLDPESHDIYEMVSTIPGYDIERPDLFNNDVELRYDPEKFPELHYKVTEELADLFSGTYFLTFRNSKGGRLGISNSELELKADWINGEFVIIECKFAQDDRRIIPKSPGRPLRIAGDKIHIVEQNSGSQTPGTLTPSEIRTIYDYNRKIVPLLEEMDKDFLKERGKHYLTLKEILMMEMKREEDLAVPIVEVSPREFKNKTGWTQGVAVIFSGESDMFDKITSPDDSGEGIRIFFKANDGVSLIDNGDISEGTLVGNLIYEGDQRWRIEANPGSEPDADEFRRHGLLVKRFANTKHLIRQVLSIDSFVFGRNGFNIFSQIDNGRLEPPAPLEAEPYMNPYIDPLNPDDSQAKAIRMALGGSRITLIQGPPGTGKSTVIVDVIRNLVKAGKKILVCTQSVQPIEELYHKVKKIKEIRCAYLRDQDSMEFSSTVEEKLSQMNNMKNLLLLLEKMAEGNGGTVPDYKEKLEEIKGRFDPSYRKAVDAVISGFYEKIHPNFIDVIETIKEYINAIDQKDVKDFTQNDKQLQIDAVDVVFGTCIGIGVSKALRGVHFDTLILDEAGKANYAETLVPMMKADNFILVGDDLQLPPFTNRQLVEEYTVNLAEEEVLKRGACSKEIEDFDALVEDFYDSVMEDVEKSLFGELKDRLPEENKIMLTKQFRMHPEIGDFVSKLFYEGKVESMTKAIDRSIPLEGLDHPIMFFDTSKLGEEVWEHRIGTSLYNDGEIDVIENDLMPILVEAKNLGKKVGIISPYGLQVNRMKERFEKYGFQKDIFTIDSIQGEEYDIVVFSFVRNTSHGSLNFIDNVNRLNVAFSRARCNLIMVGHLDTLRNEKLHAEDARQVKVIYQEIENKKVIVKNPKGGIDKLLKKFPPESCPLIKDLDHPYHTFEKCYMGAKGNFSTIFQGEKIQIFNPALTINSVWNLSKERKESFKAYFIGCNKEGKPFTMLSPISFWLLSNPLPDYFSFSASVSHIDGDVAVMNLADGSKISLKIPSKLGLKEGDNVRIHVDAIRPGKRSFTINLYE